MWSNFFTVSLFDVLRQLLAVYIFMVGMGPVVR